MPADGATTSAERNMGDERSARNGRQAGDGPLDRRAQGNKICRDHRVVAGDQSMPGERRGNAGAENRDGDRDLKHFLPGESEKPPTHTEVFVASALNSSKNTRITDN